MNNTTAAVLDVLAGNSDPSHDYNFYDFNIACNGQQPQNGVVVQGGTNIAGCTLWLHGNMTNTSAATGATPPNPPTDNVAALTVGSTTESETSGYSQIFASEIVMKVEGDKSGGVFPYGIYLASKKNAIQMCHGIIVHSLTSSNLNNGEFSFRGLISGQANNNGTQDSTLYQAYTGAPLSGKTSTSQPAVPPSETVQQNYGPDMMVYVTGGDVSKINVSSEPTGQTSGGFFIPAGGSITLFYSEAPSWTWVPAARSQY
jgi:hypothetical protein